MERLERSHRRRTRAGRQTAAPAVDRITHQGIPEVREVHSDLVGATGLELHPHQRQGAEPSLDPIMRDRLSPISAHRHLHPLGAMTADGFRDGATPGERAVAEREVFTADLARRERPHQRGMGLRRSGDQHRPCRILVEAVHDPGTRHERKRRIERKQRVLKRSTAVARPRVHHQACRLVDHPERRIPMQHAERHPGVARRSLDNQDFEGSIRVYEALIARYPFAAETRQARLDLIYAYYRGRETESALDQADTFIRENPTHPRLDYAYYIKGLTDFEREANFLERWFRVDLDQRPPQTTRRAFTSLRKVVEEYPKSQYAHDARRRMIHLRNRLADYDLHVAEHYVKRGAWIAAAQRSDQIVTEYDGAPAVQDALRIMILSYERLEMKELADRARSVYALNYGGEAGSVVPVRKRWYVPWD